MDEIAEWKMVTTNLFHIFGGICFAHPSPYIMTKHNTKETSSKCNICNPFNITKGKSLGDR